MNTDEKLRKNEESKLWYVKYWANYMKKVSDKEWSKQQNILINSIMENCKTPFITPFQYFKIKGESHICKRKN